jgi:hypothetical protein
MNIKLVRRIDGRRYLSYTSNNRYEKAEIGEYPKHLSSVHHTVLSL